MKEEIEEVLEHYPNHCIVIQPAEKFSALDFIVVDTTKESPKISLFQITLAQDNVISPSNLDEFSFLLSNESSNYYKDAEMCFYLLTSRKGLNAISWKDKEKNENLPVIEKWNHRMNIVQFDPRVTLEKLVDPVKGSTDFSFE